MGGLRGREAFGSSRSHGNERLPYRSYKNSEHNNSAVKWSDRVQESVARKIVVYGINTNSTGIL